MLHRSISRLMSTPATTPPLLVSTSWLQQKLESRDAPVSVLDGSWYLPSARRDPRAEWSTRRIPGAAYFDIDGVARRDTSLPHMLPTALEFGVAMAALGVSKSRPVVVYDTAGCLSAPRVAWTLRAFGHAQTFLLSGGLPKWIAEGRPLEKGPPLSLPETVEEWELCPEAVWGLESVLLAAGRGAPRDTTDAPLLVDARPAGRFAGTEPEPRPGLASGHVPGARSVPFTTLLDPAAPGELLPPDALRRVFTEAGVDVDRPGPLALSCGSGVTACVVWAALVAAGRSPSLQTPVYDGSWAEYGALASPPCELGPAP